MGVSRVAPSNVRVLPGWLLWPQKLLCYVVKVFSVVMLCNVAVGYKFFRETLLPPSSAWSCYTIVTLCSVTALKKWNRIFTVVKTLSLTLCCQDNTRTTFVTSVTEIRQLLQVIMAILTKITLHFSFQTFMAEIFQVQVFWAVMPCSVAVGYQRSEVLAAYICRVRWRWMQYGPLKRWYPNTTQHNTLSQPRKPWLKFIRILRECNFLMSWIHQTTARSKLEKYNMELNPEVLWPHDMPVYFVFGYRWEDNTKTDMEETGYDKSCDSSVDIATRLRAGRSGF
jgi:hypothetical protein